MIAVDASVVVAHLDERDVQHELAVERLLEAAEQRLAASPITIAEVLVGPARAGRLEAAQTALRDLGLHEVPLAADAAVRLAALRAETNLKLPDCCVLLAAQDAPAESILTFDERLGAEAVRLGLTVR